MKLPCIFLLIVFTLEIVLMWGVTLPAVAANSADEADYEDYEDTTKRGRAVSGYRSSGGGGMCPPLTLANGRVRLRSRGRIAKFLCRIGFQEMGKRFATCIRGHWNARPPICISRGCPTFASPANGRMSLEYRGALLNFDCNPGFTLVGSKRLYCDGRQWNSTAPNCEVAVKNPLKFCDFEWDELCGWSQDSLHNFDWKRFNFVTPSGHVGTGPSHDHTLGVGRDGFYMYIEASSPRVENDTARLFSPVYGVGSSENACFRFWYHMYGATTGQIRVYVKPVSKEFSSLSPKFVVSGDQGNQWLEGLVHLTHLTEPFQVIVEGVRGSSYVSDSAIDDVELTTESECNIGTTLSVSSMDSDTISDPTTQSMAFSTDLEASTSTWMVVTALHTLVDNDDTSNPVNVTTTSSSMSPNVVGTSERAIANTSVSAQLADVTSSILEDSATTTTTTAASVGTSTQNTESNSVTFMTPQSTSVYSTSTAKANDVVTFVTTSTQSHPPSTVERSSPPSTTMRVSMSTNSTVGTIAPTTTTVKVTPMRTTTTSTTTKRTTIKPTTMKKSTTTTTPSSPKPTVTSRPPTSRVFISTEAVKLPSTIRYASPAATRSAATTTTTTPATTRTTRKSTTRPTTPSAPRSTSTSKPTTPSTPRTRSTSKPTTPSTTAPSTPTFDVTEARNVSMANDTSKSNFWTTMATVQPIMTTMMNTTTERIIATNSSTAISSSDDATTEAAVMAITTGISASNKNDESNVLDIFPDETDIVEVPTIKNKDRRPPPWTYMKRPIVGTDDNADFGSDDNVARRNEVVSLAEARTAGDQVSFPTIIGLLTVGLLSMVVVVIVARKFYRRNRYGQEVLNEDSDVRYLKDGEVRVEFSDLHTTYFNGKDIESDTL